MKRRDARTFLFDIQRACQLIAEFTSGMSFADYVADRKTRSAVERQLEIVGEAMGQMLDAFPEMQIEFPDASRIISFRNRLIHGYATVSNPVVWGILENNLLALSAKVEEVLAATDRSDDRI